VKNIQSHFRAVVLLRTKLFSSYKLNVKVKLRKNVSFFHQQNKNKKKRCEQDLNLRGE
jgi:hypothetical protein